MCPLKVTIEAIEGAVTFVNGRRITEATPLKQVPSLPGLQTLNPTPSMLNP